MPEPFVGEIRLFAGAFAPRGWAFCDGQLLATSQNDALFSLLGTTYGGDGRTTFALPDLRGRVPLHAGSGPGLSPRRLGAKGGAEAVTPSVAQLPPHTHPPQATVAAAGDRQPTPDRLPAGALLDVYVEDANPISFAAEAISASGGSRPHTNLQPFLCIHFIIALVGIYPSRH